MPSIPRFETTQDDTMVFVEINVPYVRVSDMEFHIEGVNFTFWCRPYLLKLQFPNEIVDDDRAKAVYDVNMNHGTITVHLPKKYPGVHFKDLDMLTKLLQTRKWKPEDEGLVSSASSTSPLIEVLNSASASNGEREDILQVDGRIPCASSNADKSLLSLETNLSKENSILIEVGKPKYGFNNKHSNFFRSWKGEVAEIVSIPNPDDTTASARPRLREAAENQQFDLERYLLDYCYAKDDDYYCEAVKYCPHWISDKTKPASEYSLTRRNSNEMFFNHNPPKVQVCNATGANAKSNNTVVVEELSVKDFSPLEVAIPSTSISESSKEITMDEPDKQRLISEIENLRISTKKKILKTNLRQVFSLNLKMNAWSDFRIKNI